MEGPLSERNPSRRTTRRSRSRLTGLPGSPAWPAALAPAPERPPSIDPQPRRSRVRSRSDSAATWLQARAVGGRKRVLSCEKRITMVRIKQSRERSDEPVDGMTADGLAFSRLSERGADAEATAERRARDLTTYGLGKAMRRLREATCRRRRLAMQGRGSHPPGCMPKR